MYKSDLLELLHANNKEILTEIRNESAKLRQEFKDETGKIRQEFRDETSKIRQELKGDVRDETGKLRHEIQKIETRIDKLTYWILGIFGAWSTVMISVGLTFVLHNWK